MSKAQQLDIILYAAFFCLGLSVSELINALGGVKQLKRIADRLDRLKD